MKSNMHQCLETLHKNNYYIVFNIEKRKINACFEYAVDAISYLKRDGVPQIHRLIDPYTSEELSLKEDMLGDFQKINIEKAIAMVSWFFAYVNAHRRSQLVVPIINLVQKYVPLH